MTRVIHEADWALFCRVIDNHGDLGVCWRLATQLAARGVAVQLFVDDASALRWMAPSDCPGVSVRPWPVDSEVFTPQQVPGVVIEAFGCELPVAYQAAMAARSRPPVWINLEYFSLEASAQRNHGLPSPVLNGPAKGLTKWFYYPGWGENSGGLLAGCLPADESPPGKNTATLHPQTSTTPASGACDTAPLNISVFCYEPVGLGLWLTQLAALPRQVHLHVTAGRATAAVQQAMKAAGVSGLCVSFLNYMDQTAYDGLLARMDLNLVRGEDSLVRALCAGKPFLWQIYPQHDGAHFPKLQAFLAQTGAPPVVVQAHLAWNADSSVQLPGLTPEHLAEWSAWASRLQAELAGQTGLTERLMGFAATKG